jgi:hypothetical protein
MREADLGGGMDLVCSGRGSATGSRRACRRPTGAYSRLTNDLLALGNFRVVYRNSDALIL